MDSITEQLNNMDINVERYPIPNIDGYEITKDGRIWSKKSNRYNKLSVSNGYHTFKIKYHVYTISRLVAETFIPNPDNKDYVNHINGDKLDDRVENLKWVTKKENSASHNKEISHPKRVIQKDMEGKELNKFNSLKEAAESIGMSPSSISKAVLKINSSAGGYIWDYEDEVDTSMDISQGKPIYGNTKYIIFKDGTVYNPIRKKPVKPVTNASGYCYVTISNGSTKANHYIHRIVADHFLENKDKNKTQVNHKDKQRNNNKLENLEWVTQSENIIHAKSSVLI
jgi:hypothetical protein